MNIISSYSFSFWIISLYIEKQPNIEGNNNKDSIEDQKLIKGI